MIAHVNSDIASVNRFKSAYSFRERLLTFNELCWDRLTAYSSSIFSLNELAIVVEEPRADRVHKVRIEGGTPLTFNQIMGGQFVLRLGFSLQLFARLYSYAFHLRLLEIY